MNTYIIIYNLIFFYSLKQYVIEKIINLYYKNKNGRQLQF